MKTIYNKKALCILAMLGVISGVNAQEDKTKDKNLNRQMTLEREYDPSVQDANKVNTLPKVKEPVAKKMPISYSDFTYATDPEKEISLLPSGNIMTDIDYNKRRGYLNLAGGTYLNLNGDIGYHILSTKTDKLNIFFSHRSTNGNVKYSQMEDEKVKAKINDNLGGLNFKHIFRRAALDMGVKYGYSAFNYYGLPYAPASSQTLEEQLKIADRETNQADQNINVRLGVSSVEGAPMGYDIRLNYNNFSHKYGISKEEDGATEHTMNVAFDFFAPFNGNQKVGVDGDVRYFNYALPDSKTFAAQTDSTVYKLKNHTTASLSPYYKIEGDNFHVKLGARVMLVAGLKDFAGKKIYASPDIAADVAVADKTVLYAKAGGQLKNNSMYDVAQINRYADPTRGIAPSRNWLDTKIGLKCGEAPGFWFDIFGGYKITANDYFFITDNVIGEGEFGNLAHVMPDIETKQLFVGANLKYSYKKLVDVQLKGVYNNWKASKGDSWESTTDSSVEPLGKPEMELNAGITVRPIKNLSAGLDYYLATGRKADIGEIIEMNNINELNLSGSYNFNDTFSLYLKLNNVLCQKYELYYGYPMQSFNAQLGVNINF